MSLWILVTADDDGDDDDDDGDDDGYDDSNVYALLYTNKTCLFNTNVTQYNTNISFKTNLFSQVIVKRMKHTTKIKNFPLRFPDLHFFVCEIVIEIKKHI